jgi:hypothetical protein
MAGAIAAAIVAPRYFLAPSGEGCRRSQFLVYRMRKRGSRCENAYGEIRRRVRLSRAARGNS